MQIEFAGLSYQLDTITLQRLNAFFELRLTWSKTHNLSGPKARNEPWNIDVTDAIALENILNDSLPLIDVGTGSGIPGLLLNILRPNQRITLVEPASKRVAFLKTVIQRLSLQNVSVKRGRWPLQLTEPCQVVSRAVVSPAAWPDFANADQQVHAIYRYLAINRPTFSATPFELGAAIEYRRSNHESLRIERWDRDCLEFGNDSIESSLPDPERKHPSPR